MSLVNNYLKQLSRKSIIREGKVASSVPPSLQRTQKKSWKSILDKKYLTFAGAFVLLSCSGYLIISVISILLYPVVDESVAVEIQPVIEKSLVKAAPVQPLVTGHVDENLISQLEPLAKQSGSSTSQSPLASSGNIATEVQSASTLLPKKNDVIALEGSEQNGVAAPEPQQSGQYATNTGNKMDSSLAIEEPRPLPETLDTPDETSVQSVPELQSPKRIILKESYNTPDYIYQLALQAQHSNKFVRAERYYRTVLTAVPDHENALVNLSAIYIQEKRIQEAQVLLDTVLKKNPKNSKALVNFGMIALQQKNNDIAANYFLQALKYNPIEETALRNMAYLAQYDKNYTEAGNYFEQLLRISPDNIDILLAYAGLEEMKKKYTSAIKLYRQCLDQISMQKNPERNEEILIRIQLLKQYAAEQAFFEVIRE